MNLFSRKKKESKGTVVQTAQRKINSPLAMFSDVSSTAAERELFRNLQADTLARYFYRYGKKQPLSADY